MTPPAEEVPPLLPEPCLGVWICEMRTDAAASSSAKQVGLPVMMQA